MSACVAGNVRGIDACGPWRPINQAAGDVLTDGTKRAIVSHNEVGERLCGWRAPN